MAKKKPDAGTAQPDATAADTFTAPDERKVYVNTENDVQPRQHQPAVPEEAERANKEAANRSTRGK